MSPIAITTQGHRLSVYSACWRTLLLASLATGCGDGGGVDVEAGPRAGFTTPQVAAREGEIAVLEVRLDSPPESPVTINYSIGADGDPDTDDADPSDYAGGGTGSVQVPAGASGASIEITISDDDDVEPVREVLLITLQSSAGAGSLIGDARSAVVSIEEGVCDRTSQVRDLIMSEAGIDGCSEIDNGHMAGIERLTFSPSDGFEGALLTTLRTGDFGGLSAMTSLNLSENELTQLPEGVFPGLSSLEGLWIEKNQLTSLPEGVFADLSSLDFLRLNDNQLTELPAGAFAGLSRLGSWLFLHNNQLTELPAGIFAGLERVELLRLNHNRLTGLPEGVFADLAGLTALDLSANQLAELRDNAFDGLASLTELELGDNQLAALGEGVFAGLDRLEVLRLFQNRLTELPAGVLAGLSGLTWLSLRDNQLTELPEGVFSELSSLERLHLDRNQLTELPAGAFTGLSRLADLSVWENPGSPFPLTLELGRMDSDNLLAPSPAKISVMIAEGAPFAVDLRLSIIGGELSQDAVTIAAGDAASSEVTVTRTEGRQAPTGIRLDRLPQVPEDIRGIRLQIGDPLLLFAAASADVSEGAPGDAGRSGALRRRGGTR